MSRTLVGDANASGCRGDICRLLHSHGVPVSRWKGTAAAVSPRIIPESSGVGNSTRLTPERSAASVAHYPLVPTYFAETRPSFEPLVLARVRKTPFRRSLNCTRTPRRVQDPTLPRRKRTASQNAHWSHPVRQHRFESIETEGPCSTPGIRVVGGSGYVVHVDILRM